MSMILNVLIKSLITKRKKKHFKTLFIKNERRDTWDF